MTWFYWFYAPAIGFYTWFYPVLLVLHTCHIMPKLWSAAPLKVGVQRPFLKNLIVSCALDAEL